MIIFKTIRYKNFLSTGNQFNEIALNKANATLITGKNGEGKSSILCALTFGLFGKPFRNISKPQLINSINQKNCLVEIEFETGESQYLVKRGMKPNIFEIYKDSILLNQEAASRDYQKVLENILKLTYKTFTQVVILGSATFVPFMQLPLAQRREVIEEILDIKIFSIMNNLLKEKSLIIKEQMFNVERDIEVQNIHIQNIKKVISVLESNKQDVIKTIQDQILSNNNQINEHQIMISKTENDIIKLKEKSDSSEIEKALSNLQVMELKVKTILHNVLSSQKFFENNLKCQTCEQDIPESHKNVVLNQINSKINEYQSKLESFDAIAKKLNDKMTNLHALNNNIQSLLQEQLSASNNINVLQSHNQQLLNKLNAAQSNNDNIDEEHVKLNDALELANSLKNKKFDLIESKMMQDIAGLLLKDTGIKTAIINEYLPVINLLVNKYLSAMDFFVNYNLDSSFQESIKSRGRDTFTYDSFSEGEKRRLDLAILFTWRQIAKMKNSINTNILFLDEVLDGSLDASGIDYFLSIMNQFGENTNVFVISHREVADKFDNIIRVQKKNQFSIISSET